MLQSGRLQPYSKTLDETGKAYQRHSSLQLNFVKYERKKLYNIGPRSGTNTIELFLFIYGLNQMPDGNTYHSYKLNAEFHYYLVSLC